MPRKRSANGAPHLAKRPESPNWQIRHYDPVRRRCAYATTGTEDYEEAQAKLGEFIRNGGGQLLAADPASQQTLTLFPALDAYVEEYVAQLRSHEQAKIAAKHLKAILGDIQVSALDINTQQRYVEIRGGDRPLAEWDKKPVKAATISRELSVLRSALYYAYDRGRLSQVPLIYDLPDAEARTRWLTQEEVESLIKACAESPRYSHVAIFILIGLATGARPDAILGLKWDQVDAAGGVLHLNPDGRPQTAKFRPIVRMAEQLTTALEAARAESETDWVIEWGGYPIRSIKKTFASAVRRAGLKGVTPYTLRHTAASWLAQDGTSMKEIADFLGHRDTRMVEKHYAHLHPDYQKRVAAKLTNRLDAIDITLQLRPKGRKEANRKRRQKGRNPSVSAGVSMVGAAGIEPATPTMST